MAGAITRPSLLKRILLVTGGFILFALLFVVACRIAVLHTLDGISSSKATGLSGWDVGTMWSGGAISGNTQMESGRWISRNADLQMHTDAFARGRTSIDQIATAHNGFLERLVTAIHSGRGRALSAVLSVPAAEFDATVADLKKLGRVESIEEAGEDSAVRLESTARNLEAAKTTLRRLQSLQHERRGQLHDALEVEKEIAQADLAVREAERQRDGLLSTVAQAHIQLTLLEDFRAPLEAGFAGALLSLRNSMVEGVSAIFSSLVVVFGALLEYGLPIGFWCVALFWPARLAWQRVRARPAVAE
ncbi:MAG: DUF4349 domain-containing protein [Candidatus Acidiferrales bacterium]